MPCHFSWNDKDTLIWLKSSDSNFSSSRKIQLYLNHTAYVMGPRLALIAKERKKPTKQTLLAAVMKKKKEH